MQNEDEDVKGNAYRSKRELFESLKPKFGLSDEDVSVESIQRVMKANAASPVLLWDHDPYPSHDTIWTSDWDFSDPVGSVDFPVF